MTDKEFVRANWEWAQVRLAEGFEGIAQGKWTARVPLLPFSQIGFDTEAEAWAAVAEFTRERLEEVRQLERELDSFSMLTDDAMKFFVCDAATHWPGDDMAEVIRSKARDCRILARLESALADLKRGMK